MDFEQGSNEWRVPTGNSDLQFRIDAIKCSKQNRVEAICPQLGVLAAQNTAPISGMEGGQQLSISVRGLTADEMEMAGLMEISNGSTRDRVGNNTKMLGIVDGRFIALTVG